jgi:hypothetical protein
MRVFFANKDQKDSNKNGVGDACEVSLWYKWFGGKWLCYFLNPKPAWCQNKNEGVGVGTVDWMERVDN